MSNAQTENPVSADVRYLMTHGGLSLYKIAKWSKVNAGTLSRFLACRGQLSVADSAAVLGVYGFALRVEKVERPEVTVADG